LILPGKKTSDAHGYISPWVSHPWVYLTLQVAHTWNSASLLLFRVKYSPTHNCCFAG